MAPTVEEGPRVTVVIATRNRRAELLEVLRKLETLEERAHIIVVDNASEDATVTAVRRRFPHVKLIELDENRGAAARNVGVLAAATPYVAFADDDSWWASGSLRLASRYLDAHPRLALVAARILVGREERLDDTCAAMAESPLPADGSLPGVPVLGFIACGSVVRRRAFLDVGGFQDRFLIIAEEELLALDLASLGWGLAYLDDVVAHHHPSPARDRERWLRLRVRNELWTTWLRRRGRGLVSCTARLVREASKSRVARAALVEALQGLPWVLRQRKPLPLDVELRRRQLEARR